MVSISKTLGKFICWVFKYNVCLKNLWKFLGAFLLVHYLVGAQDSGLHPLFHFGLKYTFFLRGDIEARGVGVGVEVVGIGLNTVVVVLLLTIHNDCEASCVAGK